MMLDGETMFRMTPVLEKIRDTHSCDFTITLTDDLRGGAKVECTHAVK